MGDVKDELIQAYESYVSLLGQELKELAVIAAMRGWKSKRLKEGAELRGKIAELKL